MASPPASPVIATLPCVGAGPKEYAVTEEQLRQWRAAFPGIDVDGEIRKARAWLDAAPAKRKTHKGTPRFLVSWFGRAQDRGGVAAAPSPAALRVIAPAASHGAHQAAGGRRGF
jgi:hypothetical protein